MAEKDKYIKVSRKFIRDVLTAGYLYYHADHADNYMEREGYGERLESVLKALSRHIDPKGCDDGGVQWKKEVVERTTELMKAEESGDIDWEY